MRATAWEGVARLLLAVSSISAEAVAGAPTSAPDIITSSEITNGRLPECSRSCIAHLLADITCWDRETEMGCLCRNTMSDSVMHCVEGDCSLEEYLEFRNMTTSACYHRPRRRGRNVLAIGATVFGTISIVCIILRLISRPPTQKKWLDKMDDWVAGTNLIVVTAFVAIAIILPKKGFGSDFYTLTSHHKSTVLKLLYSHELGYVATICLSRISILCFYLRVFPFEVLPWLMTAVYVTLALAAAAGFGLLVPLAFQCTPVSLAWDWWRDPPAAGRCINLNALGWSNGAISLALDLFIMLMPLPELWKLRLPPKKKIGVFSVFVAWGIAVFAIIPRLVSMKHFYNSDNPTWHMYWAIFWSSFEAYISVICACLPRIYILVSRIHHRRSSPSSSPPPSGSDEENGRGGGGERRDTRFEVSELTLPPPRRLSASPVGEATKAGEVTKMGEATKALTPISSVSRAVLTGREVHE